MILGLELFLSSSTPFLPLLLGGAILEHGNRCVDLGLLGAEEVRPAVGGIRAGQCPAYAAFPKHARETGHDLRLPVDADLQAAFGEHWLPARLIEKLASSGQRFADVRVSDVQEGRV